MIHSRVASLGGVPTLFINGKAEAGMAYITYFDDAGCFRQFGEAGYRLFSLAVYFGDRGINAVTGIGPFSSGIFSRRGEADFSLFDRAVRRILEAVPEALIFPRLNMSLPSWWEEENPEQCNDSGVGEGPRRACFSSRKWREDTKEFLRRFLRHAAASEYCDHLFGYQLADGNTEEWFSYDQSGSIGPAARAEFARRFPGESSEVSFRKYLSLAAAEAIAEFAAVAREETGNRLVIGSFYGYTFEVPFWQSNHHALHRLLECPDLDFICSPASYITRNSTEKAWPYMLPVDSIKLHGKLYFAEYDSRTCNTRFLQECRPGICRENSYDTPLWKGPPTESASLGILRMNFAQQLTGGHASWWFDMWGGWFDSPAIMREMAEFRKIAEESLLDPDRSGAAECAAWIDEECFAWMDHPSSCCRNGRIAISQSGVPFDFYLIHDFPRAADRYRAAVFFIPAMTPAVRAAIDRCEADGIPFLCLEGNAPVSSGAVREFCVRNGIHCYCRGDDAVLVSRRWIAVHAAFPGMHVLTLPQHCRITPLLPKKRSFVSDRIAVSLDRGDTALWQIVPAEKPHPHSPLQTLPVSCAEKDLSAQERNPEYA